MSSDVSVCGLNRNVIDGSLRLPCDVNRCVSAGCAALNSYRASFTVIYKKITLTQQSSIVQSAALMMSALNLL